MKKRDNLNIRLDMALKERAEIAAEKSGTSLSMLIRTLLERFVDHVEAHGGKVVMPPEFKSYIITEADRPAHLRVAEKTESYSSKRRSKGSKP